MDLIVLNALMRAEETLRETVHIELTKAGWETIEFDEQGRPVAEAKPRPDDTGPMWKGAPGTHPLVPLLQKAIEAFDAQ